MKYHISVCFSPIFYESHMIRGWMTHSRVASPSSISRKLAHPESVPFSNIGLEDSRTKYIEIATAVCFACACVRSTRMRRYYERPQFKKEFIRQHESISFRRAASHLYLYKEYSARNIRQPYCVSQSKINEHNAGTHSELGSGRFYSAIIGCG